MKERLIVLAYDAAFLLACAAGVVVFVWIGGLEVLLTVPPFAIGVFFALFVMPTLIVLDVLLGALRKGAVKAWKAVTR